MYSQLIRVAKTPSIGTDCKVIMARIIECSQATCNRFFENKIAMMEHVRTTHTKNVSIENIPPKRVVATSRRKRTPVVSLNLKK